VIKETNNRLDVKSMDSFRNSIDEVLLNYLPVNESNNNKKVIDAMRYSFTVGGKRIRPMLMYAGFKLIGRDETEQKWLEPYMSAMEMIHTYSLIHDDLPAMDDDAIRRNKPTCHIYFDEATAILAGDGLLNRAFEVMSETAYNALDEDMLLGKRLIKGMKIIGTCSGIHGMIGGQAADIKYETEPLSTPEDLDYIHKNKTGAIIWGSLAVGGIIAGADQEEEQKLKRIGECIGLAFQIQDDILDQIGNEELLGKPIGSDVKNGKKTYVTFHGMDKSKADVDVLLDKAIALVDAFKGNKALLVDLIRFMKDRKY